MLVAKCYGIKGWFSFDVVLIYVSIIYIYIYVYFVSLPYLLVFGDDRIRGIREQMMLQVDLVGRRAVAGLVLGDFIRILCFMILNQL